MTDTLIEQADRLVAAGRVGDAAALLHAAGDSGDVDALFRLAAWQLIGDPLPRNVPAAYALLSRARMIGHVDAALMEIALTANGSAGPDDWTRALSLLTGAAGADPVAAEQLRLVRAMRLTTDGKPVTQPAPRPVSEQPHVRHFPALLTADECVHLARTADPLFEPASVLDPASGRRVRHPVRNADEAAIGPAREDLVVRAINLRIAAASGTDVAAGEPLTILRYGPGQQYRPHHDAIAGVANQRAWTMLVWLNDGYAGGETRFSPSGLTVKGRRGDGLLFRNLLPDGRPDPAAQHAGLPVTAGHKWMATRWIRQAPLDLWAS
ncbi:2OG-Fe(II) oxygenase [Sphingomonas jatrophae]|uniref:Prolyl 4-hydroxylase n=1 Tax=Sphingomonas jatrophae TaxID=1166337 RepID=A0A1I6LCF7_9SPHN|nr:2OG-Fe(II) oxygenase [Sphingomonas jatrophae]SFS01123.1 prolyl 4-hydroxylase [Sphingomonas jatrophae]